MLEVLEKFSRGSLAKLRYAARREWWGGERDEKKKAGRIVGVQTFVKVLNGWAYKIVKICAPLVVKSGMHVPNSLHFLTFRQLRAVVVSLPYVRLLKFLCQNILREREECRKRSKNEA